MLVSLNQIDQTCRKAARGAGLPWGVADDVGKGLRWLATYQLNGCEILVRMLQQCRFDDGECNKSCGAKNGILFGLQISDQPDELIQNPVVQQRVCFPLLTAGVAAANLQLLGRKVSLQWSGFSLHIGRTNLSLDGDLSSMAIAEASDFRINSAITRGQSRSAIICSQKVDEAVWRQLEGFAHHTYVEATDASRLAGAGAGLNDND